MTKTHPCRAAAVVALATALVTFAAPRAGAIFLDDGQNISFRLRVYSQAAVRLQDSRSDTQPSTKAGQLVQHRNFFNPELDADLTPWTGWLQRVGLNWLKPDDFRFRLAAWGFYDGIYDYGSGQFDGARRRLNGSYPKLTGLSGAFFLEGDRYNPNGRSLNKIFPGHKLQTGRDVYARQRRINELYLSYSNGPVFLRFGRQSISWGESDTVALLDQNNPFDITLAAPGIFQDLEEARIPLWTLRASVRLYRTLGPLSGGFIEAYWVPGDLDVNTGILPLLTASPYSPAGHDPQTQVPALLQTQFVLLDRVPRQGFENSRWGVRFETIVDRAYTVSAWYYTHFPNQPVPIARGTVPTDRPPVSIFTTETLHKLVSVVGASTSFFFEPLNGIVRTEVEFFSNEPGFIPELNLGIRKGTFEATIPGACNRDAAGKSPCRVPKADFLRWELGFDEFFFFRPLNPANSFLLVTAVVGSWNMNETSKRDFRMAGQRKRGAAGTSPDDFVQLEKVEGFLQASVRTDYVHGRVTPNLTVIAHSRGTYLIQPSVRYRWADWLLFDFNLIHIGGAYQGFGFFNDRDQISARVTYQIN